MNLQRRAGLLGAMLQMVAASRSVRRFALRVLVARAGLGKRQVIAQSLSEAAAQFRFLTPGPRRDGALHVRLVRRKEHVRTVAECCVRDQSARASATAPEYTVASAMLCCRTVSTCYWSLTAQRTVWGGVPKFSSAKAEGVMLGTAAALPYYPMSIGDIVVSRLIRPEVPGNVHPRQAHAGASLVLNFWINFGTSFVLTRQGRSLGQNDCRNEPLRQPPQGRVPRNHLVSEGKLWSRKSPTNASDPWTLPTGPCCHPPTLPLPLLLLPRAGLRDRAARQKVRFARERRGWSSSAFSIVNKSRAFSVGVRRRPFPTNLFRTCPPATKDLRVGTGRPQPHAIRAQALETARIPLSTSEAREREARERPLWIVFYSFALWMGFIRTTPARPERAPGSSRAAAPPPPTQER